MTGNLRLLATEHKGMKVDYRGLLQQARDGLRREPALSQMLLQLESHLTELGRRWYAGDSAVVDELLQLYCVAPESRAALTRASAATVARLGEDTAEHKAYRRGFQHGFDMKGAQQQEGSHG